jgi:phosphatidylinositol alpha-1,6-mannosyltransferase
MATHAFGALILQKLGGVPFVILAHGNDLCKCFRSNIDGTVARLLLREANLMLANSRFTAERIRRAGYNDRIAVLNPGVDTKRFHPRVATAHVREKYNLYDRQMLLTVARLVERKNIQGVLRALPLVVKQIPNLLYLIVGDGEEKGPLEGLVKQMRLQSYVQFLGHVDDELLPALYCASKLFVMPSYEREGGQDYEGFGMVFLESNACGVPVIGGRSGGVADAVIDGETGLLVDSHNVDEIASAIIRFLTAEGYAKCLGENGRRRVDGELSWKEVGERLEGYLKYVVKIKR